MRHRQSYIPRPELSQTVVPVGGLVISRPPHRWLPGIAQFGRFSLIIGGGRRVDVSRFWFWNGRKIARWFGRSALREIAHILFDVVMRFCRGWDLRGEADRGSSITASHKDAGDHGLIVPAYEASIAVCMARHQCIRLLDKRRRPSATLCAGAADAGRKPTGSSCSAIASVRFRPSEEYEDGERNGSQYLPGDTNGDQVERMCCTGRIYV
jgi:hypothetical protein